MTAATLRLNVNVASRIVYDLILKGYQIFFVLFVYKQIENPKEKKNYILPRFINKLCAPLWVCVTHTLVITVGPFVAQVLIVKLC